MKVSRKQVRKYYKYNSTPNVSFVGSLNNSNGIISGFGLSNYMVLPIFINPAPSSFESVVKIITPSDWNTTVASEAFGFNSVDYKGIMFFIGTGYSTSYAAGSLRVYVGEGDTTWKVIIDGTYTFSLNTAYWIKTTWNGTTWTVYISTNGSSYTQIGSFTHDFGVLVDAWTLGNSPNSWVGNNPFSGSIDLNACYIKVNNVEIWKGIKADESTSDNYDFYKDEYLYESLGELQDSTNVITGVSDNINLEITEPNVTFYGHPSINVNGTVSSFSTEKYMKFSKPIPSTITTIEEILKIRVSNVTTLQSFVAGDPYLGIATIKVTADGKIQTYISSNGTANDISNGITSTNTVSNNTDYYVKFTWNGSVYKIDLSTNGTSYTNYISITSSLPPAFNGLVGLGTDTGASNNEPYLGSIYLNDCYININGQRWWTGNIGKVTLKAGSKVFIPNGSGTFTEITITSDKSNMGYALKSFVTTNGSQLYWTTGSFSGTTAPSSPSNGNIWYDTTNNLVKRYNGSEWVSGFSFPIALLNPNSTSSSVPFEKQLFNGIGYVGSTIFALPNITGNIPNGRYSDKSNKVIKGRNNNVYIYTYSDTWTRANQPIFLTQTSIEPHSTAGDRYFSHKDANSQDSLTYVTYVDTVENKVYHSAATAAEYTQVWQTFAGYCTLTAGVISNLRLESIKSEYTGLIRLYNTYDRIANLAMNGTLTLNNNILSGFSNNNWAKLPKGFTPGSYPWEMCIKVTTGVLNDTGQSITGNYGNTYQNAPEVSINDSKYFYLGIPKNGGSQKIVDNVVGTYTVLSNTTYWLKLEFTGTHYKLLYSLDGTNYTEDVSVESSEIIYQAPEGFMIGNNFWSGLDTNKKPFLGTIDLSEFYINVNGKRWWSAI